MVLHDLAHGKDRVARIVVGLALGEPPAVVGLHHALLHDGRHDGLELRAAVVVPDLDPLAVRHAQLCRILGVDLDDRVGVQLAEHGDLPVLSVERRVVARSCGQDERVLRRELGVLVRTERRLLVVRQRVLAVMRVRRRPQLHAAGGREEAGLAVRTQLARLVLAVVHAALEHHLVAQVLEGHLGGTRAALREEVGLVLEQAPAVLVLQAVHLQVLAQLDEYLDVGLHLAHVHGLVHRAQRHRRSRVVRHDHVVLLGARGQGQHEVGERLDGGRDEAIGCHAPLQVLAALVPTGRLGAARGGEQRRGLYPAHADAVRLALRHRVEHHVGLRVTNVVHVERILVVADGLALEVVGQRIPADAALRARGVLGRGVVGLVDVERGALHRRGLGSRLRLRVVLHTGRRVDLGDDLAAGHVDVAADGHQRQHAVGRLVAVLVLVERKAPGDGRGLRGGVQAGRPVDILHRHLADLRGPLGRHALVRVVDARGELLEAVRPLLHEVVIVEVLVDDDGQPRHGECGVGAGAHPQMHLCARGQPVHTRVDADELRTALHEIDDRMAPQPVAVRRERHLAPHDDDLRHPVHGVVVGSLQAAGVVHLGIVSAQHVRAGHGARLVAGIARLGVAGVRRAEHGLRHVGHQDAARAPRAREHGHALGAVGVAEVVALLLDQGIGLIPCDALPLVVLAAVLRIALHRIDHAARVVHVVLERQAPGAQAALRDGVVLVALHMVEAPLRIDVELQAASYRMAARRRPHGRAHDSEVPVLVLPGLAQVVLEFHTVTSLLC